MMTIYLCGPIEGCTDEEAKGWREAVKRALPQHAIIDPTGYDYQGPKKEAASLLVRRCLDDIKRCNAVLVNAWRGGWGMPMEVFHAYQSGVWVVMACQNPGPWQLHYAADIVPTLSDAVRRLGGKLDE